MTQGKILLESGTLWTKVKQTTAHALECGALKSIPTDFEFVEQDRVKFLVRILSNLNRKKAAKQKQEQQTAATGKELNPFLPYEKDLFVADISDTHLCILNKFNVVDYHLLIITRIFEEQESLLTFEDLAAMWACLTDFDGLVFYNSGKLAGASQRHKHLQIVPLSGEYIPITPLLKAVKFSDSITTIPGLSFLHAFTTFAPEESAAVTLEKYYALLEAVGIKEVDNHKQSAAYNLLATREWMLVVPRSHEEFESISINSLGFAGALLVRNAEQLQLVKNIGPMNILKNVAFPNIKPPTKI
ncbi:phosphorylase [Anabaena sp. UHCC 0451]|uniref:ATP adenylyltransferase family protein n=1 Tax=Anabaena sp. UHCC 0451 TaxID=2055235 RepID=UPI002B1F3B69|nr:phosphorylase [Anabaena sp. UHCC 0451]MEA5575533.1 phosphorylase [Anabaena sp. UHCC 0451]